MKRAIAGSPLYGNAVHHRTRLASMLGITRRGGGGVKLTFDDGVEAFRQEFLAWLADNRPTAEEMAADPAVSSAHVPEWAARAGPAGCSTPAGWCRAGRPSAAAATPARSRCSSTWRS